MHEEDKILIAASFLTEVHGTAEPFFIVRSCRTWKTLNLTLSCKERLHRYLVQDKKNNPITQASDCSYPSASLTAMKYGSTASLVTGSLPPPQLASPV